MTRIASYRFAFVLFVANAALVIGGSDARAQFGMGFMGMGMRTVPSPQEYLNAQALGNASRATMGPVSRPVYANNPNSYLSRVRDNGFTQHYSVNSRRSPGHGQQPAALVEFHSSR